MWNLSGDHAEGTSHDASSHGEHHSTRPSTPLGEGGTDSPSPERAFQKAIEIADRQSAKSLELRAAMSLSRLWQQQGKKDEARQMLAGIHGWFTEGFDTPDLQEAKRLLTELS
jgi:hypothetical protein